MNSIIDINQIEKKAFTSTFKDGFLDILLGIILLQFAIAPLLTDVGLSDFMASAVFIPVYVIAYIAFFLLKKYVIKPRMGSMKPGPARKSKLMRVNFILFGILALGLVAGSIFINYDSKILNLFPSMFSIIVLLMAIVAAYYLNLFRLFLYGLGLAIGPLIGEILWRKNLVSHHGFPIVFGTLSFILILVGIIQLVIFLKNNPVSGGLIDEN